MFRFLSHSRVFVSAATVAFVLMTAPGMVGAQGLERVNPSAQAAPQSRIWHANGNGAHTQKPADTTEKTYWGPGDPRNYSPYWLAAYDGTFEALMAGAPLIAGWLGTHVQTSSFFKSQLRHWFDGSGSPVNIPETNPIAEELHDDPAVQAYFSALEAPQWLNAVNTWVAGQAAVIPCGQPGTIEKYGLISLQQHREGIGLAFQQFNGVYGVGKPWGADMQAFVTIQRKADGGLTYTATGDATLDKWWGWPTDPYSTWPTGDLNFKAWYVEYYGGAKAFPLTVNLGNFTWSGTISPGRAGACNQSTQPPHYGPPIDLTTGSLAFTSTGHAWISDNGQYIALWGGAGTGIDTEETGGGAINGGATYNIGCAAQGVDNAGQVNVQCGSCGTPEVFQLGSILPLTPASGTTPEDCNIDSISSNGNVTGGGPDTQNLLYNTGWLYNAKTRTFTNLQPVGKAGLVFPLAVSSDGTVAGSADYDTGEFTIMLTDALWPKGAAKAIQIGPPPLNGNGPVPTVAAINDKDTIVGGGYYANPKLDNEHAFRSNDGAGYVDLGSFGAIQYQKSCDGGVCVTCGTPGFVASFSSALAINVGGDIVGESELPAKNFSPSNDDCNLVHAVIWPNGASSPTDLNGLIPAKSGWVLTEATGIDQFGDVVGIGTHNGAPAAFLLKAPQKLSGTVRFSDGASAASTEIDVQPVSGGQVEKVHPSATGEWTVTLPAANYTITLTNLPKGYSTENGTKQTVNTINGPAIVDMSVSPDPPQCSDDPAAFPDGCSTDGFYEATRETHLVDARNTMIPPASVGASYKTQLSADEGTPPYRWSVANGSSLPNGIKLSASGTLSGVPTNTTTDYVTFQVADDSSPVETSDETLGFLIVPKGSATLVTGQASANTAAGATKTVAGGPGSGTPRTIVTGLNGEGSLMAAAFSRNPENASPGLSASPAFFEVAVSADADFKTIKVQQCGLSSGAIVKFYDSQSKTWNAISPKARSSGGCVDFALDQASIPALAFQGGTVFAAGNVSSGH